MTTPRGSKRNRTAFNSPCENATICPTCLDPIKDAAENREGQEAIYCEGTCDAWLHWQCAGLSQNLYKIDQDGDDPFYCPNCRLIIQEHQIKELKSTIESLHKEVSELKSGIPQPTDVTDQPSSVQESQDGNSHPMSGTSTESVSICSLQAPKTTTAKKPDNKAHLDDRKFNVVIYGINECDKGTNRAERQSHDLHNVTTIVTQGDKSINPLSIRDLLRLGKYREEAKKPRPILIRLTRTLDVSLLLAKAKSLPKGISIKPDMTREEREIESLLQKERWSIIQTGVNRKAIKIRSNKIFVNNKLHGQVVNSSFVSENSQAPASGMDTSNN